MNIKEYFTLKLTLEGENLQIKHFVPMVINIHDIVDMEISQSILGKLLGYSTVTFFTETRSTYSYVDIINGRRLINAIKKRQPYKTPVEDPDNLFNNLVGKKIAPTDPFQAQNSNRASREERRPRSRRR